MSDRKAQFRLCLAQLSPSMFMLLTVFTMFSTLNTSSSSFNTTYFIRLLLLILLVSKVSLNVTSYILVFICRCSVNFMLFLIYFDGPMINLNQIHNVLYEFTMPFGCYFTWYVLHVQLHEWSNYFPKKSNVCMQLNMYIPLHEWSTICYSNIWLH